MIDGRGISVHTYERTLTYMPVIHIGRLFGRGGQQDSWVHLGLFCIAMFVKGVSLFFSLSLFFYYFLFVAISACDSAYTQIPVRSR